MWELDYAVSGFTHVEVSKFLVLHKYTILDTELENKLMGLCAYILPIIIENTGKKKLLLFE